MENPFRRQSEDQITDIEFLRNAFENAVIVVNTSNARDYDFGDRNLMREIRQANPEAAKDSNWPIKEDTK